MAVAKKTATKEVVKEEVVVDTRKDEEIAKLQKEKEQMGSTLDALQAQMAVLMKQMSMQSVVVESKEDREVEIVCNCINGGVLNNNDGSIRYELKYQTPVDVAVDDLKKCFRATTNKYIDLFRDGLFAFVDKELYSEFKIRDVVDLSDEALSEMVNKGEIPYQEKIRSTDSILSHTIIYRVSDLKRQGKLRDWSYSHEKAFEAYFGIKVDECINQLNLLNM